MTPDTIARILAQHDDYWEERRAEMRELKSFYMTRYWKTRQAVPYGAQSQVVRTELPKGYAVIESYLGSLFRARLNEPCMDSARHASALVERRFERIHL